MSERCWRELKLGSRSAQAVYVEEVGNNGAVASVVAWIGHVNQASRIEVKLATPNLQLKASEFI